MDPFLFAAFGMPLIMAGVVGVGTVVLRKRHVAAVRAAHSLERAAASRPGEAQRPQPATSVNASPTPIKAARVALTGATVRLGKPKADNWLRRHIGVKPAVDPQGAMGRQRQAGVVPTYAIGIAWTAAGHSLAEPSRSVSLSTADATWKPHTGQNG